MTKKHKRRWVAYSGGREPSGEDADTALQRKKIINVSGNGKKTKGDKEMKYFQAVVLLVHIKGI